MMKHKYQNLNYNRVFFLKSQISSELKNNKMFKTRKYCQRFAIQPLIKPTHTDTQTKHFFSPSTYIKRYTEGSASFLVFHRLISKAVYSSSSSTSNFSLFFIC